MSENNERVSIIVPVYNVEEHISACIDSIVSQTYSDLEIILVNDGSTDKSGDICNDYANKDDRIKVVNKTNGGVSSARNCGLDISTGKYIAFVDSDDTIEKNLIENLHKTLKEYNADCVNCATNYVYEGEPVEEPKKNVGSLIKELNRVEAIDAICYLQQVFSDYDMAAVWGCLYKRSVVGNIRFDTDIIIGEDFQFKFSVLQNINKIVCIDYKGYNYLVRKGGVMRTGYDARKVVSVRKFESRIRDISNEYKDSYISRVINIGFVVLFTIPIEKEYYLERKFIIGFIKRYRKRTLKNPKTRKKVKVALSVSYLGFNTLQSVFSILTHHKV